MPIHVLWLLLNREQCPIALPLVIVGMMMMYTVCSCFRMFYPHSSNPLGRYFDANVIFVID